MNEYDHLKIEKKWQSIWQKKKAYKAYNNAKKKKSYVLDMFPYPSGTGLHVGHPKGYIGSDIYARMKRMQGFNVLHPMGYDAFGLPAEQYALEHHIHPRKAVEENIKTFEKQLNIIGLSYDWDRKVNTTDPNFYKWTQWIFLKLYNSWFNKNKNKAEPIIELIKIFEKSGNSAVTSDSVPEFTSSEWKLKTEKEKQDILMNYRLAYEGYSEVNWSPVLGTVLANDEVVDSSKGPVSERGGFPVVKKEMRQWFLRITAYADRLLEGLEKLDWSEHVKEIQRNWIGKSEGLIFSAKVVDSNIVIKTFSAHFEACFADTFFVIAPDHPLLPKLMEGRREETPVLNKAKEIVEKRNKFPEGEYKEIEGIFTGRYATDPLGNGDLPIWVGSFALANYGTGIVKCSAHDDRDFAFAKKYNIKLKSVVEPETGPVLPNEQLRKSIVAIVEDPKTGKFLTLNWGPKLGGTLFIGGGRENNEDEVTTAIREIKEETGFTNLTFVGKTGKMHHHYFAFSKNVARNVEVIGLHFFLNSKEQVKKELMSDEKGNFKIEWLTKDEIFKKMEDENHLLSFKLLVLGESYSGDGILIEPFEFKGRKKSEARNEIANWLVKKGLANKQVNYRMRDAVFARQRYWGEPIPLWHDKNGIIHELKERELPLKLPEVRSYEPTGTGESPLAGVKAWVKKGLETNTMPGWAGSSWYYLRYMDPKNKRALADKKAIKYWREVDMYVGGEEHATGHLLYSRFWHKFLKDYGVTVTEEPFKTLKSQGYIYGMDGRKMSKRWGNTINPNDVVKTYGADTLRVYEMFMGPFEGSLQWSTDNIIGSRRFIERVWKIAGRVAKKTNFDKNFEIILHKTVRKVTEDIGNFAFNTAISSMMILVNEMDKRDKVNIKDFELFLKILSPFAPHMTEEIWSSFGHKSLLVLEKWPKPDVKKMREEEVKIAVQINNRVRAEAMIPIGSTEEEVVTLAKEHPDVSKWLIGKEIKKTIYIKEKLLNFVVI